MRRAPEFKAAQRRLAADPNRSGHSPWDKRQHFMLFTSLISRVYILENTTPHPWAEGISADIKWVKIW
jgi:hypothetical protein